MNNFRGSQKHLLDYLDEFGSHLPAFNEMLSGFAELRGMDICCPKSTQEPDEYTLRMFLQHTRMLERFNYSVFGGWWVPEKYKNPTWDLLCTATIQGKRGLVLVEAKAHQSELKEDGKPLAANASIQSQKNHDRIAECIAEASHALDGLLPCSVNLSIDSHYQLANRIASAWKLSSCGLPVVLLYLGFIGDTYFEDHFCTDGEWQDIMRQHLNRVFPQQCVNIPLMIDETPLSVIIRSLPVRSISNRT